MWCRISAVGVLAATVASFSGCGSSRQAAPGDSVIVVQTSRDLSQRLTRLPDRHFGARLVRGLPVIAVDDRMRYQRIEGVGAAITDTAAWLLERELSARTRTTVLRSLFGTKGVHLRFVRVPIGASDFTRAGIPYTYDDVGPGRSDWTLSRFSVAHDDAYIVPLLREVRAINHHAQILASSWSPPAWMKSNDALDNRDGSGRLLQRAYAPLARYYVKFIQAYARRGVPIDAITPQNEPDHPTLYPGLDLPALAQAKFVAGYLAPTLRAAGVHLKIYGLDSFWSRWADAQTLVGRPATARAIVGIAWHCYIGNLTAMAALHRSVSRLDQIVSECSSGIAPGPPAELLIASIRNWASAVILWNLALDSRGGPVQRPNTGCSGCTGVVTVGKQSHTVTYRADFYQLGQLSRFVQSGARRVSSPNFVSYNSATVNGAPTYATAGLDDVAFVNPDGTKVLLAYNNAPRPLRFAVAWHRRAFAYRLPAGGTVTFVWR